MYNTSSQYEDYPNTPNSRTAPPMPNYVTNNFENNDHYKRQPARTSSLPYFERESVIDPTAHYYFDTTTPRHTLIENNNLIQNIDNYTKDIQSNVQNVINSPIQVQHGYVELPQPSSAIIENAACTKNIRKQPPPPLVIPPSPTHNLVFAPARTSSIITEAVAIGLHTPGELSTPESCRSENTQDSSYTSHMIPSPLSKKHLPAEAEAESLLHQGIKHHEAGRLEEATKLFKQASQLDLPIAMFLYGISLRHGWGCVKNEFLAFQYLQKAAEHAVEDLSSLSSTVNMSAAKSELIMAIYELGVSFRHGWGCKKNKETAVYYFKIAADLNDPDAQNDLGHCYYHGHGVKKDLFQAAKYYRLADKQGHGIMGNSWIWKSKYDKK